MIEEEDNDDDDDDDDEEEEEEEDEETQEEEEEKESNQARFSFSRRSSRNLRSKQGREKQEDIEQASSSRLKGIRRRSGIEETSIYRFVKIFT